MKQILTLVMLLTSVASYSQDTTGVMITLDEVIYLDYKNELDILNRYPNNKELAISVASDEVLCLHFYDNKNRYRTITSTWSDGYHSHHTVSSRDEITCTKTGYGSMHVLISEPRKSK